MASGAYKQTSERLSWPDTMKGISILWIVFFHFFLAYGSARYPWPVNVSNFGSFVAQCAPTSFFETVSVVIEGCCAAVFQRGAQAVGVFLVLSGFGLTYSLAGSGLPKGGWKTWYRRRLLRLFPVYWLAHVIYLVSPFVHRRDPVDYRFILSLLGDRVYPVDTMFYYISPAWWFFGLLLELYIVFPVLYRILEKLGAARYLVVCGIVTFASRYMLFGVLQADGNWVQGAFFGARLWEFALGMVIGGLCRRDGEAVERRLFSWPMLAAGIGMYVLGAYSYSPTFTYAFTDALIGSGLFVIIAHVGKWIGAVPALGSTICVVGAYSYGLYLFHHPYVIYFGERLRGVGLFEFIPVACAVTAVIALCSIPLEMSVNKMAARILEGAKPVPASLATPVSLTDGKSGPEPL